MTPPPLRVLIFGNSHANCVAAALKTGLFIPEDPNTAFRVIAHGAQALPGGIVMQTADGRRMPNPIVLKAIADFKARRPQPRVVLVSIVGGNQSNRLSMFRPEINFDFALQGESGTVDGASYIIPFEALAKTIRKQLGTLGEFLSLLPRDGVVAAYHVEGPSPIPSNEYIFNNLPAKTIELAARMNLPVLCVDSIASPALRLKLFKCQQSVVRELAEQAGFEYVGPPAEAVNGDGFRVPITWRDAVHGSPEYGAMVLREIERRVQRSLEQQGEQA